RTVRRELREDTVRFMKRNQHRSDVSNSKQRLKKGSVELHGSARAPKRTNAMFCSRAKFEPVWNRIGRRPSMRRFGITLVLLCWCTFGADSSQQPAADEAAVGSEVATGITAATVATNTPLQTAPGTNATYKIPEL